MTDPPPLSADTPDAAGTWGGNPCAPGLLGTAERKWTRVMTG
jgi:hypothetical protein